MYELLNVVRSLEETDDYESDGGIRVVRAVWANEGKDLELWVELNDGNDGVQTWKVLCRGTVLHRINFDWNEHLEVLNEHPVLWPYTQTQLSLWFSGKCENASAVIGDLWLAHRQVVGESFSFGHFLNSAHLLDLIADGYGKLGDGPDLVIQNYETVLQKHGFKTSTTPHNLSIWSREIGIKSGEKILLCVGDSHVIARNFEAEKIV